MSLNAPQTGFYQGNIHTAPATALDICNYSGGPFLVSLRLTMDNVNPAANVTFKIFVNGRLWNAAADAVPMSGATSLFRATAAFVWDYFEQLTVTVQSDNAGDTNVSVSVEAYDVTPPSASDIASQAAYYVWTDSNFYDFAFAGSIGNALYAGAAAGTAYGHPLNDFAGSVQAMVYGYFAYQDPLYLLTGGSYPIYVSAAGAVYVDPASIRSAVGLGSADLDTQLSGIQTIKTQVAAWDAGTDAFPAATMINTPVRDVNGASNTNHGTVSDFYLEAYQNAAFANPDGSPLSVAIHSNGAPVDLSGKAMRMEVYGIFPSTQAWEWTTTATTTSSNRLAVMATTGHNVIGIYADNTHSAVPGSYRCSIWDSTVLTSTNAILARGHLVTKPERSSLATST